MRRGPYLGYFDLAESAELAKQVEESETAQSTERRVNPLNAAAFAMLSQAELDEINSDPSQAPFVQNPDLDFVCPSTFVEERDELLRTSKSRIAHRLKN